MENFVGWRYRLSDLRLAVPPPLQRGTKGDLKGPALDWKSNNSTLNNFNPERIYGLLREWPGDVALMQIFVLQRTYRHTCTGRYP